MAPGPLETFDRSPDSIVALGGSDAARARTWADLILLADRLRSRLGDLGWRRTVVFCNDRFFMLASLLACWAEGRVAVLPPNGRSETVRALIASMAADGFVHDGADIPGLPGLDVATTSAAEGGSDPTVPSTRRFTDLLAMRGNEHLVNLYSSGTTGEPVPSRKTAGQLLGEARALIRTFGLGTWSHVLTTAPPHHIYGLLFGVLAPVLSGGVFVRQTPLHAEAIAHLISEFGVNVLCAVPPHLYGLQALAPGRLSGLMRVFSSGAKLPAEVAEMLRGRFNLQTTEVLGSSETGGIAWRIATDGPEWLPLAGVVVAADDDGILLLDSPFLDPDAPRPFRGSDRIETSSDGRFRHLGRADAIVKVGGERVSLAEIERRLLEIEGVRDAAVLVRDEAGIRQHEICAAVVAPGLSERTLRLALSQGLASVAIPRRFALIDQLPREDSGKIQRSRLAPLFEAAPRAPA